MVIISSELEKKIIRHTPTIGKIVKKTALEFDLPYNEFKTFGAAFYSHYELLKSLAKKPNTAT